MGLVSKSNAKRLQKQVVGELDPRGNALAGSLYKQFNEFHAKDVRYDDYEIESLLMKQRETELVDVFNKTRLNAIHAEIKELKQQEPRDQEAIDKLYEQRKELQKEVYIDIPRDMVVFSPSSASKCVRELFFRGMKERRDAQTMHPYQRRWVRNGSAVHEATQRDLLYMEKVLDKPAFVVERLENGLPAWENNIKDFKVFEHNGQKFVLLGMTDGILQYTPDGTRVGFEFKTKSTTIASVGGYKMKDAQEGHKTQTICYSLLFDVDEFLIMYESLAKDNWGKGEEARSDIRTFYNKVTPQQKKEMLDKFALVAKAVKDEKIPAGEYGKCLFCEYKSICKALDA
jgi:hypothetical protein